MHPYDNVAEIEKRIAEYAGAPYGVAVNSCTNALMLSIKLRFMEGHPHQVLLPAHTYVGVPYAVVNAGGTCLFEDFQWSGAYSLEPLRVVDSARRFRKGMYVPHTLYCLSFHWGKLLPIGRGGMILCETRREAELLKRMRFDGRKAGCPPSEDHFHTPGYHCYMIPEDAARGLMLMSYAKDEYEDLPWDDYSDLSKFDVFKEGI